MEISLDNIKSIYSCWSTVSITDSKVNEYLEHQRESTNETDDFKNSITRRSVVQFRITLH